MKKYAPLLIITAASLWGTMGLWVRYLNDMGLESMEIVEMRSIISSILLIAVTGATDRRLLRISKGDVPALLGSGIFSVLFFNFCYFSTISMMDLSIASILLYTSPIFVMLLSVIIFHEELTSGKLISLALAFAGCCLVCGIFSSSVSLTLPGLLLGLGSGIGYALYTIFSRISLNRGVNSITITIYTFLFSGIAGIFLVDLSAYGAAYSAYGIKFAVFAVVYTVITTVLPYLVYTTGLRFMDNGTASVIAFIEPVVATLLGFIVYSETPSAMTIAGIVLVLSAIVLLNKK